VSTTRRRPDGIQRFNARQGDLLEERPMVILINGVSVGLGDVAARWDHGRAIVMGTPRSARVRSDHHAAAGSRRIT
jgi:carboxyl-terminal processing protease